MSPPVFLLLHDVVVQRGRSRVETDIEEHGSPLYSIFSSPSVHVLATVRRALSTTFNALLSGNPSRPKKDSRLLAPLEGADSLADFQLMT